MSYAHSFNRNQAISAEVWSKIKDRVLLLWAALPDKSTSAGGYFANEKLEIDQDVDSAGCFIVNDQELVFNGIGRFQGETFYFSKHVEPEPTLNQCDTARMPYDLFVASCLIVINHFAKGSVDIQSDGKVEDWKPALTLVRKVFDDISVELPASIDGAKKFHLYEEGMSFKPKHVWF